MSKKSAYITGASSGIGEAFAFSLADNYNLVLIARNELKLQQIAKELRNKTEVEIILADLSTPEGIGKITSLLESDPELDLFVNNAAYGSMGNFVDREIEEEVDQLQLNVMAVVRLSHAVLKNYHSRKHTGNLINVASMVGFFPTPTSVIYGASKAFVKNFSESLHEENKPFGITVQVLCPGFTRTEFQDRAGFQKENLPDFVWMDSKAVVEESLNSLKKQEAVCIPGVLNRSTATIVDMIPGEILRILSGFVVKK